MNFPVWILIGPWRLPPHPVFETLAYAVAAAWLIFARRRGGDPLGTSQRMVVASAALLGSVAGARLLAWPAGKTVVGGLLGGLLAVEFAKRWAGIRQRTGDLFVIPACVGIAVGRIGCFLTGLADDTYGNATTWVTGVDFGDGIRRHPTQLYDSAFVVVLAIAFAATRHRPLPQGARFRAFMLSYLGWRLAVDVLKPVPRIALGLSAIQWAAIAAISYYVWWWRPGADATTV